MILILKFNWKYESKYKPIPTYPHLRLKYWELIKCCVEEEE